MLDQNMQNKSSAHYPLFVIMLPHIFITNNSFNESKKFWRQNVNFRHRFECPPNVKFSVSLHHQESETNIRLFKTCKCYVIYFDEKVFASTTWHFLTIQFIWISLRSYFAKIILKKKFVVYYHRFQQKQKYISEYL